MSIELNKTEQATAKVVDLIERERAMALSARELQHRLAGYGYALRDTEDGQIVESLPHHVAICKLPHARFA